MTDTTTFASQVLLVAAVGLLALLSNRLTERIKVPAPLLVLVAAAAAVQAVPALNEPPLAAVQRLVTVALVCILFDGGMHIGWRRFRGAAGPIAVTGVLGTFLTAGAIAVFLHVAVGLEWFPSMLVATAISPTDPAVVFSVLGQREVAGRSGTILEGESGANDPVGIALMASLLAVGGLGSGALGHMAGEFALQMGVGAVVGILGGRALLWFMRAVPLPSEGLYPIRTAACVLLIYGVATVAHGSGFLAVFVAGILLGDERAPYKREIERFHSALASLGEIVAFVVLGLTVDLGRLSHPDVWLAGLAVAVALAVVVRPVFVGLCLLPAGLRRNELAFVLFAGLKGAVPILLGGLILADGVPGAERLYGIVVVVVIFSVLVQGSLVPATARMLKLPMRTAAPQPWALGVRLADEPEGAHHLTIAAGSPADGHRIEELAATLPEDAWISLVVRDRRLLPVRGDSELRAGDEVLVIADPGQHDALSAAFSNPA